MARVVALEGSCDRLASQLEALDAAFYACAPYDAYGDPGFVRRLTRFAGVGLAKAVRASYRASSRDDGARAARAPRDVRRAFAALSACVARLDGLCARTATAPYPARAPPAAAPRRPKRKSLWRRVFGGSSTGA